MLWLCPAQCQPLLVSGQCGGTQGATGHTTRHGVEGQSDRHIHRATGQADRGGQQCSMLTTSFSRVLSSHRQDHGVVFVWDQ